MKKVLLGVVLLALGVIAIVATAVIYVFLVEEDQDA